MISCLRPSRHIVAILSTALSTGALADQAVWGQYNLSTIDTYPGEGGGHIATLVFTNRINSGANWLVLTLNEGVEITVTVNDAPGDVPDRITVSVPAGYAAIPPFIEVGEEQSGTIEIFDAGEIPLG